ncbi:MerR family transcriptional regulator [Actinomadura keratinilytica]|jgi:DNA-binding transcriptional MerR regulator|uniref:HTH merR-type domain-containing protein n=1 Tax=Actinomadura keratinilytica TaxID=547461 RepID=A0ABP7Y7P8_9ACTN
MAGTWTISELAERAVAALSAGDPLQVSGRVRDLPNERLIRWYTTIGLVDPPLGRRGRTALYGPRHLLQIVAVKRRQAAGRTIAEIQLELAGATDDTLREIAQLPDAPTGSETAEAAHPRSRFWATRPAAPGTPADVSWRADIRHTPEAGTQPSPPSPPPAAATGRRTHVATSAATGDDRDDAPPGTGAPPHPNITRPRRRAAPAGASGASQPAASSLDVPTLVPAGHGSPQDRPAAAASEPSGNASPLSDTSPSPGGHEHASLVQGVRLAPGLTVLLDAPTLSRDDLAAIADAARPLLDELRRRGLLAPLDTHTDPSGRPQ